MKKGRGFARLSPVMRRVTTIVGLSLFTLAVGTLGYRIVSHYAAGWLDCLYMTVITVLTVGYGEVIDLSGNAAGRIFTMIIAFGGIGIVGYALSSVTAFAVGGELRTEWRKWHMQKAVDALSKHYVLCGWNTVAAHIANELTSTGRSFVVVGWKKDVHPTTPPNTLWVEGDPADDEALRCAGIDRAAGLFATEEADPVNIVICMTARQMNSALRIVALASDAKNESKLRKAGADAVVSASRIGGLRMASEMIRPSVVNFLDTMLRDLRRSLRIEEIPVGRSFANRPLSHVPWQNLSDVLVLAIQSGSDWKFNPPPDWMLAEQQRLVVMCTEEGRKRLEQILAK